MTVLKPASSLFSLQKATLAFQPFSAQLSSQMYEFTGLERFSCFSENLRFLLFLILADVERTQPCCCSIQRRPCTSAFGSSFGFDFDRKAILTKFVLA